MIYDIILLPLYLITNKFLIKFNIFTCLFSGFCEMVLQGEVASSVLCDMPGQSYPQSPSPTEHDDPAPHSLDVASGLFQ